MRWILGKISLICEIISEEELITMLAEEEAVLNSRPLSFVYSHVPEPQPLPPSHFVVGKRLYFDHLRQQVHIERTYST